MAKYYGTVGFAQTVETAPGVWSSTEIVTREYAGDVLQNTRRWENSQGVNDNLTLSVRISIIADDYASQNLPAARYATYRGDKFEITSIDDSQYPRLVLTLGGVYNG